MTKEHRTFKVFISYSHDSEEHRAWVRHLAERLQSDAIPVWLDEWEIKPGQDLALEIENAISSCRYALAICTPTYKRQVDQTRGRGVAFESALLSEGMVKRANKFIPVLISGTWHESCPSSLRGKQYVDFTAEPYEKGYAELLQTLTALPNENSLVAQEPTNLVVELILDTDFHKFTQEVQAEFLVALSALLSPRHQIRVLSVAEGSTKITLELTHEQAEQLFWLYKRGALNALGVKGAKMVGDAASAALVESKSKTNSYDVFMCYNSEDKAPVRALALRLRREGILPWFDEWELRPGLPWQTAIEKHIQSIASAAICVGTSGIGPWQDMEVNALMRQFVARSCPIIPVILRGCRMQPQLPVFLDGMTWVDFNRRRPDPYKRLIWGIIGDRGKSLTGWWNAT
jgi:TIR domain